MIWKITPKICSGPIFPIISYQRLFRHQIFSLGFPTQLFSDYFEIVLHWFFCPTYIIMILFANALCIFSQFSEKWRPILKQILTFLLCVCFFLQFFNTWKLKSKKKTNCNLGKTIPKVKMQHFWIFFLWEVE